MSDSESSESIPADDDGRVVGLDLSAICAAGMQAEVLTGMFRDQLTRKFLSPDYQRRPSLRELLWKPDEKTNILIESHTRWKPELTEKRPALIVKANSYRNYRVGIGDMLGGGMDAQGSDRFSTFWVGSHTVFAIRDTGAAAVLLGAELRDYLTEIGPRLRHHLQLMQYQVQQVSGIGKVPGAKQDCFASPVTVGWAYEHSWKVVPEALPLRGVSLRLLTEL